MRAFGARVLVASGISLALLTGIAAAQDLEPRAYSASPTGANFLVAIAGRSTGSVLVDPSVPVEDVRATVDTFGIGAGTTIDLFGRTALFTVAVPYALADATGRVGENTAHITRSGLADPRMKISVNLLGGRAVELSEFAKIKRPTIVGVSLTVASPLGQYDRTKLINLGVNRWAFKPELGVSRRAGLWTIEGYCGVLLFAANDEFYPGNSLRTQRPIVALQAHASYTAKPRLWIALDATWYSGGRTTVNDVLKADLQRNSRVGATISVPARQKQSIKASVSTGATTRSGSDFTTVSIAWQVSWFGRTLRIGHGG
jgi:Putative MetA-pathway of phenol degradation